LADGSEYVGEFRDGDFNGQGTFTYVSGNQYVGEWRNDKQHGRGTHTLADGSKYVGQFRDGQKHGIGTYTFANGSVNRGRWTNDEFLGPQEETPSNQVPERVADNEEPIEASSGTGFFVSRDGHILTNQHVIDSCQDVQLHANGVRYSVVVIAADRVNDIALLKADLTPPAVFPLSTEPPYLLQNIYAAGYPFGDVVSSAVKVTSGIVSSLVGIGDNVSNLQIDAALQPGNSGGPIIDEYGNAIGIAVAKLDLAQFIEAYQTVPENVNFGIRASVAGNLLDANNVVALQPSSSPLSQQALGRRITDGTVYISCWMTAARIEEVRSRKALFEGL
jgi:S1-C subfamily serine protease